jgi:hypothetical protein
MCSDNQMQKMDEALDTCRKRALSPLGSILWGAPLRFPLVTLSILVDFLICWMVEATVDSTWPIAYP